MSLFVDDMIPLVGCFSRCINKAKHFNNDNGLTSSACASCKPLGTLFLKKNYNMDVVWSTKMV